MIKMQVYLREEQKAALRKMAARTGTRESDLVRKSVDMLLDKSKTGDDDWRAATLAASGIWKDRDISFFKEIREATRKRLPHIYGKD